MKKAFPTGQCHLGKKDEEETETQERFQSLKKKKKRVDKRGKMCGRFRYDRIKR